MGGLRMKRIILAAIATAIASTASAQVAPNCGLTGKWTVNGTLTQLEGTAPNQKLMSFVLDCSYSIANNGNYSGGCTTAFPGRPLITDDNSASGRIVADANCQLSGYLNATQGRSTIFGGAVNGNIATLVAYRGSAAKPQQVRFLTLIKEK
jgi:hypothetical protein